jgi:hypothetical protein
MGKSFTLAIILLSVASSLILTESAFAQSIPKPFVPEFSLIFVDASYDVPTTHTIDPYTGQDITNQGYHVNKIDLVMIIQNQPLVYQYNGSFLYNIHVKGHYAQNWTQLYLNDELPIANASSTQTSITIGSLGDVFGKNGLIKDYDLMVPSGGQEDFQVQAMIGGFFATGIFGHRAFQGESSGWSNTQTITIPASSTSPSPTPTVPEFPLLAILSLFFVITLTSVLILTFGKRKNKP